MQPRNRLIQVQTLDKDDNEVILQKGARIVSIGQREYENLFVSEIIDRVDYGGEDSFFGIEATIRHTTEIEYKNIDTANLRIKFDRETQSALGESGYEMKRKKRDEIDSIIVMGQVRWKKQQADMIAAVGDDLMTRGHFYIEAFDQNGGAQMFQVIFSERERSA